MDDQVYGIKGKKYMLIELVLMIGTILLLQFVVFGLLENWEQAWPYYPAFMIYGICAGNILRILYYLTIHVELKDDGTIKEHDFINGVRELNIKDVKRVLQNDYSTTSYILFRPMTGPLLINDVHQQPFPRYPIHEKLVKDIQKESPETTIDVKYINDLTYTDGHFLKSTEKMTLMVATMLVIMLIFSILIYFYFKSFLWKEKKKGEIPSSANVEFRLATPGPHEPPGHGFSA